MSVSELLTGVDRRAPRSDADRLNGLRAGVLGANDGIVSVAAIVVGVAGASAVPGPVIAAGLAALLGGALSMALGEYVSVAGQRDAQRVGGAAHDEQANPWTAAGSSALSFLAGGALPLAATLLAPAGTRVVLVVAVVLAALAVTGAVGAALGRAPIGRATLRVVVGGGLALAATFLLGHLVGASGLL